MSLIKFGKAGCLKPLNIRAMIHYYIDFQIVAIILRAPLLKYIEHVSGDWLSSNHPKVLTGCQPIRKIRCAMSDRDRKK